MQRFFAGLGQKQTYDLNGVPYEVSSRFVKDRVESKNTIRNRVERILQNPVHLTLLSELVEKIIVHKTEGTGRNRTQRIEICCRFIGYLDISEKSQSPIRQGVEQAFYTA